MNRSINRLLPLLAAALCFAACGRSSSTDHRASAPGDSAAAIADTARRDTTPTPPLVAARYHAIVLGEASMLRALRDSLGEDAFALVLALNRVDLGHARSGDTLVLPEPADSAAISPFPAAIPGADSLPKLLVVSNRVQAWAAYANGRRVKWGACCTGRRTKPTPVGLYHTNWRQPERHSTIDGSWLLQWYVNLDAMEGVSFHVFDLPGRPASHSCVRLSVPDAQWIYRWCDTWRLADKRHVAVQGTPAIVLDRYAFGSRRPWRALTADPHACDVSADSLAAAIRGYGLPEHAHAPADTLARVAPADSSAH